MAKPFKRLIDKMPQERRETIEDRASGLLLEMAIAELRQSRQLTQQQVAESESSGVVKDGKPDRHPC